MSSIMTPVGMLSFPNLFTPQSSLDEGGKEKYGCAIVFDKDANLSNLKNEVMRVGTAQWGEKFTQMVRDGTVRLPFRNDGAAKGYPEGSTFINIRSTRRPGIVDAQVQPIIDEGEIYPGCFVRATVTAFTYDVKGNKGVSFGLNNVQKVRDGEPLDGRRKATDEFEAMMEETPASVDELF